MLIQTGMKLWCFLHAFQNSPFRYLYLSDVIEALTATGPFKPTRDSVFYFLENRFGVAHSWWLSLVEKAEQLEEKEMLFYQPERHQFIFYGEVLFPKAFIQSSNPPLALSVEGNLSPFFNRNISVVGSREPHEYSKQWMQKELYQFLKRYPTPVISGGARGIDQMAHRIALLLDLPTAVILPSGLGNKYPALWSSTEWSTQPVTFISELCLSSSISKRNFSSRNRLIAAFSEMTLIVEARGKSGTLITAHHALIEGKALGIVPGHPQLSQFAGSLQLLVEGGDIVRDASDLSLFFRDSLQDSSALLL